MPAVDDITSLPLTPALLNFYREKLRDNVRQASCSFKDSLDRLLPELDHVHQLELSLSSSIKTIKAFESENDDLKALLSQLIEENARLRLQQNADCVDSAITLRLLESLSVKSSIADHSKVISSLVERCEALERFATQKLAELKDERTKSEELSVQNTELQESLRYNTKQLTTELYALQGQPSAQDWEFLKSEIELMIAQQTQDRAEIGLLRTENEKLRGRIISLADCSAPSAKGSTVGGIIDDSEHDLAQDLTRLKNKLQSLEKFANRFMPDDHVKGVPEFFHTVDKTKGRLNDFEERLARRRRERQ